MAATADAPTQAVAPKPHERAYRIATTVLLTLIAILAAVVVTAHIVTRVLFAPFYADATEAFPLPGLGSGFVPQDLAMVQVDAPSATTADANAAAGPTASATGEAPLWLFSGYQADGGASPVWVRTPDGKTGKLQLQDERGNPYDGHGSGVSSNGAWSFVTCEGGYLVYKTADLAEAAQGAVGGANASVKATAKVGLDFTPAFLNVDDGTLYVGEFFRDGNFATDQSHHLMTPDGGTNHALMYAYDQGDGPYGFNVQANRVYSIPEQVQGCAVTDGGDIVLSTSYGVAPSYLQVFDHARVIQDGTFVADGREVPLYCLDSRNLKGSLAVPPMSEGIVAVDETIYVSEESASSKYLFGRFYGAGSVYALPASTLESLG